MLTIINTKPWYGPMVKGLIDKMAVARNTTQNWGRERGVGTTLHLVAISKRLLCAKSGHSFSGLE